MAELWPNAAAALGWSPNDREKRLDTLSAALNRSLNSANDITTNDDFSRVKNHLLALAKSGHAVLTPPPEPTESRQWKIKQQVRCLSIYLSGDPDAAQTYVKTIIASTANRAGFERESFKAAPLTRILPHLSLAQITNLVKTLDRCLHNAKTGFRVKAGHTIHQMSILAGVKCPCAACRQPKPVPEPVNAENCPF